ncbi:MAG: universal stress protein [Saprospiraceae bacterium]|nr:universal stress protein [Lewinella sp.]
MKPIKRAMIALDLSPMDETLLKFTRLAHDLFELEKLYFVHIIPDFISPKNEDLDFHNQFSTDSPLDEALKSRLEEKVLTFFRKKDQDKLAVEVIEGRPYQQLAKWAEVKDIDLLIFGKKKKSAGSGITAKRAARQIGCHLFMIPETDQLEINRMLVPMDFSDNSVRALLQALSVRELFPEVKIEIIHLVRTLTADHYYGLTQSAAYRAEAVLAARKAYDKILEENEISEEEAPLIIQDDDYGNVYRQLWEYSREDEPDLVIIGAQGHSAMHHFLYGSVTEDFVDYCEDIPILVVR